MAAWQTLHLRAELMADWTSSAAGASEAVPIPVGCQEPRSALERRVRVFRDCAPRSNRAFFERQDSPKAGPFVGFGLKV
jgi:hypothetical protein